MTLALFTVPGTRVAVRGREEVLPVVRHLVTAFRRQALIVVVSEAESASRPV